MQHFGTCYLYNGHFVMNCSQKQRCCGKRDLSDFCRNDDISFTLVLHYGSCRIHFASFTSLSIERLRRFAVLEIVRSISPRDLLVRSCSRLILVRASRLGSSSTSFYRSFLQRPSASVRRRNSQFNIMSRRASRQFSTTNLKLFARAR